MRKKHTIKAVYSALFTALIFIGTQFIRIPLPLGYFNMGDCFILLSAVVIGGPYAIIASALGATLADILSGYIIYAPATIIIKSVMVIIMIASLKLGKNKGKKIQNILFLVGAILSEIIMMWGYFIYDTMIYSFTGAIATLPGSILQGISAVITSLIIVTVFERSGLLKHIKPQ